MTLTVTTTEAKEELANLHGVKPDDIIIVTNETNMDASFFTNLRAGQKVMAIKIVREQFDVDLTSAKTAVEAFMAHVLPK